MLCSELSDAEAALVQGAFLQRFVDSLPTPSFTGEIEKAVCHQPASFLRVYAFFASVAFSALLPCRDLPTFLYRAFCSLHSIAAQRVARGRTAPAISPHSAEWSMAFVHLSATVRRFVGVLFLCYSHAVYCLRL